MARSAAEDRALRVGLLGGTFDPIHNAHLAMARAALEQLKLDRILFIPTGAQHYREPAAASDEHRVAMLGLALAGEPRYEIDTRELAPGATGHTVDTLKGLRLEKPFLLMGADQYAKLASWHRPEEVRRLSQNAVFARPGIPMEDGVKTIAMPPMRISASEIRARVARGEDISGTVPPAVARHIAANGLYR
jgi:nicotinate-nucleotide adenylyltransferase